MTPVRTPFLHAIRAGALASALLAAAYALAAEPFAVRVGAEKIVLDAPAGFSDTGDLASPRLQDLASTLTAASNRVLLFALSDADVRRFMQGDQLDARRYMVAATPKAAERESYGIAQFGAFAADSLRTLGKPAQPDDVLKYLEQQPIGRVNLLAELRRDPNAVSVLQGIRLPPLEGASFWDKPRPQYQLSTTTLLLVRGKALQLSVFTLFAEPGDADWLRTVTQRWTDELLRLNR